MKVAVVGGGALGMLFSSKMSLMQNENVEITLYTRTKDQAEELRRHGAAFKTIDGKEERVMIHAAEWSDRKQGWDVIILTVKQMHVTTEFVHNLATIVSPNTVIICFQNGLGHMDKLSKCIHEEQLFYAITTEAALKTGLSSVAHTGKGRTLIGSNEEKRLAAVMKLLHQAGFQAELSKNIESVIWNKLLINACINPLTTLFNVTNGELIQQGYWRELMQTLLSEGLEVSRRLNIETAADLYDQLISVCQKTSNNRSSMLQDLSNGKKTEIDYINGSIVRLADELGASVPVQRSVWQMIKGLELK